MARQLQTFGYEGLTIQAFIERLKRAGTEVVVDVRANPLSRKHGFSKKSFAVYLEEAGIQYVHSIGVGCPKPVRDRYKADGDWAAYTAGFKKYLKGRTDDVAQIAAIAKSASTCLVCFEEDHERCHRKFVADAAAAVGGLHVVHLSIRTATPAAAVRSAA
ncbi:DUF488 domain-containing protein [Bradyrhizobium sp. 23]|uniref:DUF488 domain-containing protein n=1 Tax=Bradyrhizobium sp. 23 TaxID=2782667 RepID=UPI001FF97CCF|nr:DUF488 domain-containing protein [Bradyrhizobium sp. 23]MCK1317150.1 DUF488 domain-containing protein [Bradyrhizobium sp. 23]